MAKPLDTYVPHHFVDTAYGLGGKRLTLGRLEALCAAARARGAGSDAVVTQASATPFSESSLRITWSD